MTNQIPQQASIYNNFKWSWDPKAKFFFEKQNALVWEQVNHNPITFLETLSIPETSIEFESLPELARNWEKGNVAYVCMEYGIHESFPNYSGGLGVLAGDHLKAASDLSLPLTAFGMLYKHGYFCQIINENNKQIAEPTHFDPNALPMKLVLKDGEPHIFSIPFFDRSLFFQVWKMDVGSVPIYLFDTDIAQNLPEDRGITDSLYGGDHLHRLKQEILLGFGTVSVSKELGLKFDTYHLNEGHASFTTLALWDDEIKKGLSKAEAENKVKNSVVFTTHTMVPAGHDVFGKDQIANGLSKFILESSLNFDDIYSKGVYDLGYGNGFNMTVLGLNFARVANGVSKVNVKALHNMWGNFLETHNLSLIPITNGIHPQTFLSEGIYSLLKKYTDFSKTNDLREASPWDASKIPDNELWETHCLEKINLIKNNKTRIRAHLGKKVNLKNFIINGTLIDPTILTIGFARRFATYKRATLIFHDEERILDLLTNPEKPVQVIFSGKPHPRDEEGKKFLKKILDYASNPSFQGRVAFIADYDMGVARKLISGVDVWLNTPRVPREASGTSGMKAAINGVLNASTFDGWWPEAYNGKNGWVIGKYDPSLPPEEQDIRDVESFYHIMEKEIIPTFYTRDKNGIPVKWVNMMKESIKTVGPHFNSHRMVMEYSKLYFPR